MSTDQSLREERLTEGLCPNCGTRLYKTVSCGSTSVGGGIVSKMSMFKKKSKNTATATEDGGTSPSKPGTKMVPLTVAGLVERGQCLKCQEEGKRVHDDTPAGKSNSDAALLPTAKAVPVMVTAPKEEEETGNARISEMTGTSEGAPLLMKSPPEADLLGTMAVASAVDHRSSTMSSTSMHADSECGQDEDVPLLDLCNIDLDPTCEDMHRSLRAASNLSAGVTSTVDSCSNGGAGGVELDDRKPPAKSDAAISIEESADRIHQLREAANETQSLIDLSFLEGQKKPPPSASSSAQDPSSKTSEQHKYKCPSGMSPDVFYELPPEMQKEVSEQGNKKGADNNNNGGGDGTTPADMDPETLASLPEHIRREVLDEARRKQSGAGGASSSSSLLSSPTASTRPSLKSKDNERGSLSKSTTDFLQEIQIDVTEFESYPEEIKNDIIAEKKRRKSASSNNDFNSSNNSSNYDDESDSDEDATEFDRETLASLPEDVRKEVLEQEKRERVRKQEKQRQEDMAKKTGRGSVGAHSVNIPAGYDPDTFAALPEDMQQELLDDAARRRRGSGVEYAASGYDNDAIMNAMVAPARPSGFGPSTACTYTGDYNAYGKRHGDGELVWANEDKYVGKFKDGFIEGRGTISFHDGTEYAGQWRRNRFHGDGTRRFSNGNVYTGNYVDGKRQGQGRCYFANGDMYVGDWKNDTIHGFGRYYYNNGHSFEGMFRNGKRNGRGKYQLTDGRVEIYRYVNDSRAGDGVRWSANRKKAWRMVDGKVKNKVSMEEATGIANKCGPVVEES